MKAIDVARWGALAAVLIASVTLAGGYIDGAALRQALLGAGTAAPVLFVLGYAVGTVAFLPGSLFALAAGALFGPIAGAVYSLVGATAGATGAFLIARFVAADWVSRKAAGRLQQLVRGVEDEGWRFVALMRLVPLVPFNLLNYVLGLTRIPDLQYVVTSFICMAPGAFAYTYLGFAGREAASGSEHAVQQGSIGLALLAAVIFLPRLVMRFRRARIARVDAASVRRRLDAKDSPLVLDVRSTDEYRGELGHIAGSRNIPLPHLAQSLAALEAYRDKPVIIVCRTDRRSDKAGQLLAMAGFRVIEVMDGGMESWHRLGYPVVR